MNLSMSWYSNAINSDSKKRRSFVTLLFFAAGYCKRSVAIEQDGTLPGRTTNQEDLTK